MIKNDNAAAVTMVKQNFSSAATRHVKIMFHFIREKIKDKEIRVEYCPTADMVADMMTKALDRVKFERFRDMLMNGVSSDGILL